MYVTQSCGLIMIDQVVTVEKLPFFFLKLSLSLFLKVTQLPCLVSCFSLVVSVEPSDRVTCNFPIAASPLP